MTIATQIAALQQDKTDIANAITAKGGTVTTGDGFDDFASDIATIPSGTAPKFGMTIDNFIGDVDANDTLKGPTTINNDIIFTGVKHLDSYALYYLFYYKVFSNSISIYFPDLEDLTKNYSMQYCFYNANLSGSVFFLKLATISGTATFSYCLGLTKITSVSFPELLSISGYQAAQNVFNQCTSLTSVSFPKLTTISGFQACMNMFSFCNKLTSISFPKLETLSGQGCFAWLFAGCSKIEDVYFNSLTTTSFGSYTDQFTNMMNNTGTTVTHTIHFPSNLQSTISGLTGYPNFGGTSGYVMLAFDLPATS